MRGTERRGRHKDRLQRREGEGRKLEGQPLKTIDLRLEISRIIISATQQPVSERE